MRVVLSVDMEGISQLTDPFDLFSYRPEYWCTGKPRIEADTVAAAEGLLEAGADEVIVLDNHGSGNPENVSPGCLPAGARLETWNVFDLLAQGVDAMLQVGYHARGGIDGFVSHTYMPNLRLRVDGEPVSESHGRAWAAAVPLIGIVGNDDHRASLGSLAGTPYLVVQHSQGRDRAQPAFADAAAGLAAIRTFAADSLRAIAHIGPCLPPPQPLFEASLAHPDVGAETMLAAGWARSGGAGFSARLERWEQARELLAAAMAAAMVDVLPHWLGATSEQQAASLDSARCDALNHAVGVWFAGSFPQWYDAPAAELEFPSP
jgi:D-aminopeptidase